MIWLAGQIWPWLIVAFAAGAALTAWRSLTTTEVQTWRVVRREVTPPPADTPIVEGSAAAPIPVAAPTFAPPPPPDEVFPEVRRSDPPQPVGEDSPFPAFVEPEPWARPSTAESAVADRRVESFVAEPSVPEPSVPEPSVAESSVAGSSQTDDGEWAEAASNWRTWATEVAADDSAGGVADAAPEQDAVRSAALEGGAGLEVDWPHARPVEAGEQPAFDDYVPPAPVEARIQPALPEEPAEPAEPVEPEPEPEVVEVVRGKHRGPVEAAPDPLDALSWFSLHGPGTAAPAASSQEGDAPG